MSHHGSGGRTTGKVDHPRVSIAMPFLNARGFIGEAIESVLAQTCPHWELLLVDDGSEDGSAEVAAEYQRRDPSRIRVLRHPGGENRGTSASRNLAIANARGEYLALLDADDVWLPRKLEEQLELLDRMPIVGLIYGHTPRWYSWTGQAEDAVRDHRVPLGVPTETVIPPPELLIRCLRGRAAVPGTCSILVRREIVERVGGFESSFHSLFTDQAFYAKVLLHSAAYVADREWDRYRQHADSSCVRATTEGRFRQARIEYLSWVCDYLEREGMAQRRVWREARRELWLYRRPAIYGMDRLARRRMRMVKEAVKGLVRRHGPPFLRDRLNDRWRRPQWQTDR